VTSQNVVNLVVTEYIAPASMRGRMLANSTQLSATYVVSVSTEQVPGATYNSLSTQLTEAVNLGKCFYQFFGVLLNCFHSVSGVFNTYLIQYAVEFGATGMYSTTSFSVVTTNDVVVTDDDNGGGGGGDNELSTGAIIGEHCDELQHHF
jgi:hypothetical protein